MKRRIRRIRRALKRAGLYNAFHITLIAVLLTGFCVILFNVKESEQQEEKPETTQAEVMQNPETMTQTAESIEDKYKVFDTMSEDWGSDDLEGFVFYDLPEKYADKGYFPEKMQIYTRCLCKQNDVPYALVLAIIEYESGYEFDKTGDNGNSKGYMQIYEKWHTDRMQKLNCTDLMNPYQNVKVGIDFLSYLLKKYGTVQDALAAYNYGERGAREHLWNNGVYVYSYNTAIMQRSLFDGISVGMLALKRAGFDVEKYYASEIKTKAMKCSFNNWGDAIEQIGDVRKVDGKKYDVDIIIGGSPCQNFSRARTSHCNVIDGLAGEQSSLFFEYLRILKENNPKYFFLENVWMPIDDQKIINRLLGVEPIRANSSLVSYQQRDRLYWTNIPGIELPKDRHINFQDYKDTDEEYCDKFIVNRTPSRERMWGDGNGECPNVTNREKINCITLKQDRWKNSGLIAYKDFCRYLTTRELEIGQTLPVGYTKGLSKNEAEDVIGDAWTADMIAHFFGYLKRDMEKKQEETK